MIITIIENWCISHLIMIIVIIVTTGKMIVGVMKKDSHK